MNPPRFSTPILVVTLVANGVLGMAALGRYRQGEGGAPAGIPAPGRAETRDVAAAGVGVRSATAVAGSESEDRSFVEGLRSAGFPPAVLRSMAAARISAKYAARFQALAGTGAEYWKGDAAVVDPASTPEWRALKAEMGAELAAALGPDYIPDTEGTPFSLLSHRYGFLTEGTLRRLADPANGYPQVDGLRESLAERARNRGLFPEEAALSAPNRIKRRETLEGILPPEELAEYDFHVSSEAAVLRRRLAAFDPTEAEFRALFRIQEQSSERNAGLAIVRESSAAQGVQDQIRAALGPGRYEDYVAAAAPEVANTAWLTARLGLGHAAAAEIGAIKRDVQSRATPQMERAAADILRAEAQQRIAAVLGPVGAAAYGAAASTGLWLRNADLQDAPPAASRAGADGAPALQQGGRAP